MAKLKIKNIYDPEFVDKINRLFQKPILTDAVVANGYVDPTIILKHLNYQIQYDPTQSNQPDPKIDYQKQMITISNQDALTRQRFLLAKGFGMIILHQKHL